jgi:crossover junction endodeoxyribonuclease RuvC
VRVLGVDGSSSSAGFARAVGGELVDVDIWKPAKQGSKNDHLFSFFVAVGVAMDFFRPDAVGYEEVKSARNMNTVRILARWEGAVIIQARKRGIVVQPANVKEARKIVVGDGAAEKKDVLAILRKRYPDLRWRPINSGGGDQADAGVVALATPDLLERR